ncbi:hypothetical protein E2C01_013325 [Portunus trituberculatus]|uniref:Uncharacterized protein n=1 Tax=Portunus trituberculatus TaxID=210409 RepID=A0A5B7DGU3_PORTR|nr:hypothetical protein [Portunus trituberculatus]
MFTKWLMVVPFAKIKGFGCGRPFRCASGQRSRQESPSVPVSFTLRSKTPPYTTTTTMTTTLTPECPAGKRSIIPSYYQLLPADLLSGIT